jgi:hypothetical protein
MCFSPEVDLVGGAAIAAIGIDTLHHVDHRSERPLAILPIVFGLHQMTEAFVWWGLDERVAVWVGDTATWLYLSVAFGLLPWFVPWVIRRLEADPQRRRYASALVVTGVLVSVYLMVPVVAGPIRVVDGGYYLAYSVSIGFGGWVTTAYVAATCGSLLVSSDRYLVWYGMANLVAVAILSVLMVSGVISLWCVWAAVTSIAIAVHLRRTDQHRRRLPLAFLPIRSHGGG